MSLEQDQHTKQDALIRILQVASGNSAQWVMYSAAALGIVALIPGMQLPPELAVIAGGIGVEAIGSLIDRIAKGENQSDEDIQSEVERTIRESGIEKLLTQEDFYHAFEHLRRGQRSLGNQNKQILEILRLLESKDSKSGNTPLLEIADETLIVNLPVGDLIYSVQGPLLLPGQEFPHVDKPSQTASKPLLYDHRGNAIENKSKKPRPTIQYSAKIVNKGEKTAEIYQVFIDHGSKDDEARRVRLLIGMQKAYLTPGEFRQLNFELLDEDMRSVMRNLQIDECILFLRVICRVGEGMYKVSQRGLGGFRQGHDNIAGSAIFTLSPGDALTGPFEEDFARTPFWIEVPVAA